MAKINMDLAEIGSAIQHFQRNNGGEAPESLELLVILDSNGKRYFSEASMPLDPYAQSYVYSVDGDHPSGWDLRCLGADHAPGGIGQGADTVFGMGGSGR